MMTVVDTSSDGSPDLPTWQHAIATNFVPCQTVVPTRFRGAITDMRLSTVRIGWVRAMHHRAERTLANIDAGHKGLILLNLVTSGSVRVLQDGRETELGVGEFAIHDSTRPYSLLFATAFSQLIFQFPRALLRQRIGACHHLTAVKAPPDEPLVKLAASFMLNVANLRLQESDGPVAERLALQVLDLVAMAYAPVVDPESSAYASSHRSALLYRAKAFVDSHLHEKLAAPIVGRALGCSARYVNTLFAAERTTLGDYVMRRRLQQCRLEIESSVSTRRISEIAYAWGFKSVSHFSRRFKEEFGMSPTECRALNAEPDPAP